MRGGVGEWSKCRVVQATFLLQELASVVFQLRQVLLLPIPPFPSPLLRIYEFLFELTFTFLPFDPPIFSVPSPPLILKTNRQPPTTTHTHTGIHTYVHPHTRTRTRTHLQRGETNKRSCLPSRFLSITFTFLFSVSSDRSLSSKYISDYTVIEMMIFLLIAQINTDDSNNMKLYKITKANSFTHPFPNRSIKLILLCSKRKQRSTI